MGLSIRLSKLANEPIMLTVERELTIALYALYAIECIHWLKEGQVAVTRKLDGTWRVHECGAEAYTLLGRMPVFVNPFDLRPSFARIPLTVPDMIAARLDKLFATKLPEVEILTAISIFNALNLLLILPLFLVIGFIPVWWEIWAGFALLGHIALNVGFFLQGRDWRRSDAGSFWRELLSILLNPLAALRCGDVLLREIAKVDLSSDQKAAEPSAD